jgi:hypothetical protein
MNLSYQKKKLLVFQTVAIILIFLHNILDKPPSSLENWWLEVGWHYWVALGFGIYIAIYILTLQSHRCGKYQIYRGVPTSEWYCPEDTCWNCGHVIRGKK